MNRLALCVKNLFFIFILLFVLSIYPCNLNAAELNDGKSRISQYTSYKKQQNYKAALDVIRQEVSDPMIDDDGYIAGIRVLAINALQHYVNFHGIQPEMDWEAEEYYEEAMYYARDDVEVQAQLNHAMMNYYSWSNRNGLALPYLLRELEYWKKVNNTYQIIVSYNARGSIYNDSGQLELRDFYKNKAMDIAKDYFVLGKSPSDANEWLQYKKLLVSRIDNIAVSGSRAELMELWGIVKPIVKEYISPQFMSYLQFAEYLGIAGETEEALKFYEQAKNMAADEGYLNDHNMKVDAVMARKVESDLACKLGHIYQEAGQYGKAVREIKKCIRLKVAGGMKVDIVTHRMMGLAYEGIGDYDRAIESFSQSIAIAETIRLSYDVAERAAFFRGSVRKSYWGLIRCLAKQFSLYKEDPIFLDALQASEMVRGRQFGEILDKQQAKKTTLKSLEHLRSNLGPDEIILDYMFMDKNIVLFAITKEERAIFMIPKNKAEFRKQVLMIAKQLSSPSSSTKRINSKLARVSQKLLEPVRDMMKGKKQVTVLPDGMLNAVPFDLLTLNPDQYSPLINELTVSNAPSLKYLTRSRQTEQSQPAGLFALADPKYAKSPKVTGLSETDLRSATRGSEYLAYFQPLPETLTEVKSISELFEEDQVKTLMGTNASESKIKSMDLSSYSYLHFATHGILGTEVPGVAEPALVFAEESGEDGFFMASEAEKLKLNAKLTVLSACNTGSGKYYSGEGIMGMSRSFLLAGSQSVLVSLWSVDSKATELLMVSFYKHLNTGLDASTALRKAKLEMMSSERHHPFFWSAFILVGT